MLIRFSFFVPTQLKDPITAQSDLPQACAENPLQFSAQALGYHR